MTRIETLTDEQQARFGEFVEKWTRIGLSTEPTDRKKAVRAVDQMYRCAGLPIPKRKVFCGSPLSQGLTRAIVSVGDSVRDAVRDSVWGSVRDAVRASVRDAVRASVRASISGSVRASVEGSVSDSVRASISGSVRDSVWGSVRASVWDSIYGQHEAHWLGFYDFFREVCGLNDQTKKLEGLWALAACAGWALPHENICWISERHNILRRNEHGQPHATDGPAIQYPDGWSIYALNGVCVEPWIVETPANQLDPRKFSEIENAEIRREFVRKIGVERIVQKLGAERCDKQGDYELLLVDLGGRTGKWPYLKMRNPSIGVWHLEAVAKECRTVEQALNFRNGGEFQHIAPMT